MSIQLNDREAATCRIALQIMMNNKEVVLWKDQTLPMSDVEIEELIETMGPDSGYAFGERKHEPGSVWYDTRTQSTLKGVPLTVLDPPMDESYRIRLTYDGKPDTLAYVLIDPLYLRQTP